MIDFIIPCHPKDFPSLELASKGILDNISCHNRLFVISNQDPNFKNVIHIPEQKYSKYITIEKIYNIWMSKNPNLAYRCKWIYQQFLKLLSGKIIDDVTESFVIVDSDTIFLRDVSFDIDKFNYSKASEYHWPYLDPVRNLLNIENTIGFSTISHHCIFNKNKLNKMINEIETRFNKPISDAVLDVINYNESSCFSEWDLYANYMLLNYPDMCDQRQLVWNNFAFIPNESDLNKLKKDNDFISCHAWMRGLE